MKGYEVMKKWRYTVCGYIHQGDIPPDSCPICGAGKESFEELPEYNANELTLKEKVAKYLIEHRQCVIGTSINDIPFTAKVYCYAVGDYELVFSSFPNSNKYKNLLQNQHISIAMDDGSPGNCLHYQGTAHLIESKDEVSKLKAHIISLDAPFRKFMERPDLKFFKIRPSRIFYTDYMKKPFHRDVLTFDKDLNVIEVINEKIF